MLMNYDTKSLENDPDHKDVTPVMHSVPHVPFVLHTTRKGAINNATTTETQKDITVVKLNFRSASSSPV